MFSSNSIHPLPCNGDFSAHIKGDHDHFSICAHMCRKSTITGEWIYGITWKHAYFNIFVLFIVDSTSILKLVFPTIVFPTISVFMVTLVAVLLALLLLLLLLFIFIFLFVCFSYTYLFLYYFCRKRELHFSVAFYFCRTEPVLKPCRVHCYCCSCLSLLLLESSLPFVCVGLLLLLIYC